jgi:hypothetical protein
MAKAVSVRQRARKRAKPKIQPTTQTPGFLTPNELSRRYGLKYRLTLRLVKQGIIPSLGVAPPGQHTTSKGKPVRKFFLIPIAGFERWYASIGSDPEQAA